MIIEYLIIELNDHFQFHHPARVRPAALLASNAFAPHCRTLTHSSPLWRGEFDVSHCLWCAGPSASKVFTTITSSPPDSVNTLSTLCQSSARQASQRLRILDVKLTCNDNVPTECDLHAQRHCC